MSQDGGTATVQGDKTAGAVLAAALAAISPEEDDELTHGFHSYPARMHFGVARTLIDRLAGSNTRVLDPFCGSGTVLIEAFRRGLPATGFDLSPLALRIAEVKCARRDDAQVSEFSAKAKAVVQGSAERVEAKVRVRAPLLPDEREWYDPHVLLELAGLLAEIEALPDDFDRRALQIVLSSIVIKFSRQRADTVDERVQRHIAPGVPTQFFGRKAEELAGRWATLAALVTKDAPRVQLRAGDARRLPQIIGPKRRYDLVVSSPPYGGTYDYVEHHRRRRAWLGLTARDLERGEIGARRRMSDRNVTRDQALQLWDTEMSETLISIAAVLSGPEAPVVLFVGDGEIAGKRVQAVEQLHRLASAVGMHIVASASLPRTDWQGGRPRAEHLVQLQLDTK